MLVVILLELKSNRTIDFIGDLINEWDPVVDVGDHVVSVVIKVMFTVSLDQVWDLLLPNLWVCLFVQALDLVYYPILFTKVYLVKLLGGVYAGHVVVKHE